MHRRDFIRKSCFACAAAAAAGAVSSLLSGCSTLPLVRVQIEEKKLLVDKTLLPPDAKVMLLRSKELEYDVLLVRTDCGKYHGLYMQCTHNNNALSPTAHGIFCHSHDAEFDLEGNVKSGPPKKNLRKLEAVEEGGIISLRLSVS